MNHGRSYKTRARDSISNAREWVEDAWDRFRDYTEDNFLFIFFLISVATLAVFGMAAYIYTIVAGELPMCNPSVVTTQTTVEVRNVTKPLVTPKLVTPGKLEWREAGVYTSPDEGWQTWEGDTQHVGSNTLAVRTVTDTDGKVCTAGTIYLGARDGEMLHLTKVEFHNE